MSDLNDKETIAVTSLHKARPLELAEQNYVHVDVSGYVISLWKREPCLA